MEDIKEKIEKSDKKDLKKFVYSIRLTVAQHQVLKKSEMIKTGLDELVKEYLKKHLEK